MSKTKNYLQKWSFDCSKKDAQSLWKHRVFISSSYWKRWEIQLVRLM